MVFNKDCLVGLTIDEKYEIQEYRDMMKAFSDAATEGNLDQVKHGLAIGADLDGLGEKWTGWTALHAAADNQQAHVVKWLLDQGADRNKITLDYSGYTALHLAVGKTNYEIVTYLLDAGADTEIYTASDGYTPLHIAAAMGEAKLCLMLISGGSDVAAVSGEGSSILHYLAISQNPEATQVVSTILGKAKEFPELDINLPDWDGHTPLMKAAAIGDEGIVVVLLNAGADVTVKEETFGKTAELMADECAHMNIVELIQKAAK